MKHLSIRHLFPDVDPKTLSWMPVLKDFYEGVMITDTAGRILFFNEAQADIDDLASEEVLGKKVTEVYRVDEGISPVMQCLKKGKSIGNLACYYRTRLGKIVNSIHNVFPLYAGGRLIGAVCFVRDYRIVEQTFEAVSLSRQHRSTRSFDLETTSRKAKILQNGTRFTFDHIIGNAPDFLQAVEAAKRSADSPSPVLLFGQTGTGKELFAQSIHNHSHRRLKQFVAVNCAAIPENLLEGILFGTSRGAFTGSINKPGLFERADGGTLLLDEINAMPIGLQAKLLRTLQEKKVRRVGSLQEIEIDVKIISSVNEEPHQAISRGALRPDLYYRLGVVFIRIPTLRERLADLDLLIDHFLQKANARLNTHVKAVSPLVAERFRRYEWPGNIRELEHVIEGTLNLMDDHRCLETSDLPGHIGVLNPIDENRSESRVSSQSIRNKTLSELQMENEIRSIETALAGTGGNAARAAGQLGLSPQLLQYKLKKYNIDRKKFKGR